MHPLHLLPSALVIVTYFSCVTVSVWPLTVVTVSAVRTPPRPTQSGSTDACVCVCVSITLQTFLKYWAQVEQIYFCEQVQAHQWLRVFFWKNDILDKSSGWESLFIAPSLKSQVRDKLGLIVWHSCGCLHMLIFFLLVFWLHVCCWSLVCMEENKFCKSERSPEMFK